MTTANSFEPIVSNAGRFLVFHEESFSEVGISSNVYITKSNGKYFLFDASGHPELLSYLNKAGIQVGDVGAVFLTHGHRDHIRGLISLFRTSVNVNTYLISDDLDLVEECLGKVRIMDMADGEPLLRQLGFEAIRTPGHTRGSVCFYSSGERLLVSGDTVFADGYFGRTDLHGGNDSNMRSSLKLLCGLDVQALLPGHGHYLLKDGNVSIATAEENAAYLLDPSCSVKPAPGSITRL